MPLKVKSNFYRPINVDFCVFFQLLSLAKQLDFSERQIERWWRRRKAQDKPTTLVKFCENCWRCMYYTYSFVFGMIVMWDKSWLWDIKQCWLNYPHQVRILRFFFVLSRIWRAFDGGNLSVLKHSTTAMLPSSRIS